MSISDLAVLANRSVAPEKCNKGLFIGIGFILGVFIFVSLCLSLYFYRRSRRTKTKEVNVQMVATNYSQISALTDQVAGLTAQMVSKDSTISNLTGKVAGLEVTELDLKNKVEKQKQKFDDLTADYLRDTEVWKQMEADLRHSVDLALQREKYWDRERAEERDEVKVLRKEAGELRPRIGEQQDQIRALRLELQLSKQQLEAEKARNTDLARKVAFVTVEAAKHRLSRSNSKSVRQSPQAVEPVSEIGSIPRVIAPSVESAMDNPGPTINPSVPKSTARQALSVERSKLCKGDPKKMRAKSKMKGIRVGHGHAGQVRFKHQQKG
jgi:predicted  nucleic acid-binding Zn-ribbon protein